jgi:F0F1-type ATP synthase assembly protein I
MELLAQYGTIHQTPESLFDAALAQVESASIKEWATKQSPAWLKIIQDSQERAKARGAALTVDMITALIVGEAIGLWC